VNSPSTSRGALRNKLTRPADGGARTAVKAPEALHEELDQALQLIASQPYVGVIARNTKLSGVRRILLNRVDYLYYRIIDAPTRSLQVIALWHAQRGEGPRL
jgi:plasmid stabilization system protein ParE